MTKDRMFEVNRYTELYRGKHDNYRIGVERLLSTSRFLNSIPSDHRCSYLDVGCGYGDVMEMALVLGFQMVAGTEAVPDLVDLNKGVFGALAHCLPFKDDTFDVVGMWDVMEHLLQGDDRMACSEMGRVAKHHILISLSNQSTRRRGKRFWRRYGELHINRRSYDAWDYLFKRWFDGARTIRLGRCCEGQAWRIDL